MWRGILAAVLSARLLSPDKSQMLTQTLIAMK
jgi:hypothetical protein